MLGRCSTNHRKIWTCMWFMHLGCDFCEVSYLQCNSDFLNLVLAFVRCTHRYSYYVYSSPWSRAPRKLVSDMSTFSTYLHSNCSTSRPCVANDMSSFAHLTVWRCLESLTRSAWILCEQPLRTVWRNVQSADLSHILKSRLFWEVPAAACLQ